MHRWQIAALGQLVENGRPAAPFRNDSDNWKRRDYWYQYQDEVVDGIEGEAWYRVDPKDGQTRSRHHIVGVQIIRDGLVRSIVETHNTNQADCNCSVCNTLDMYLKQWFLTVERDIKQNSGGWGCDLNSWTGKQIYTALIWNPGNLLIGALSDYRDDDPKRQGNYLDQNLEEYVLQLLVNSGRVASNHRMELLEFYYLLKDIVSNRHSKRALTLKTLQCSTRLLRYANLIGVFQETETGYVLVDICSAKLAQIF